MKKLLILIGLFIAINCKAQVGLMLTGKTFTSTNDSASISTLYVVPQFSFDGVNTTTISFVPAGSKYRAAQHQAVSNEFGVALPIYQYNGNAYPTKVAVFTNSTNWLQSLGFTVTTF